MKKNIEENNDKISFMEKMKDKKYSAKVQLIGYGIFILLVLIYATVSNKNYNYSNNTTNKTTNNNEVTSNVINNKSLLESIKDNYNYEISLSITTNNDTKDYNYRGYSYNNEVSINYDNNLYYYKDNEYYKKENDDLVIIDKKDIYNDIDNTYLELKNILKYIDKSSLDRTTNYSSGEIDSVYYLYLKDMITNYNGEEYIEILVNEKDDVLSIKIDYSNFMNYKNKDISKYIVDAKYTDINELK